jgi:hypothetical protein
MRLKSGIAVLLGLGGMACSGPTTQPAAPAFVPQAPTPAAGRLQVDPRSGVGLGMALVGSPQGVLEVRLEVGAGGKVGTYAKVGGSDPMYFQIRTALRELRFTPRDPADRGPWVVRFVIEVRSTGHGSAFEGMHSGSSQSSATVTFRVVDVTTAP